ncbi:MAG: hypothetical protein Q7J29_05535 [Stagnimonas sp.]|nr:hypothetical protein [Stagnimonas sp.]
MSTKQTLGQGDEPSGAEEQNGALPRAEAETGKLTEPEVVGGLWESVSLSGVAPERDESTAEQIRVAWAFNIAPWKRAFLQSCFPEFEFKYIAYRDTVARHDRRIKESKGCVFIVWGLFQPEDLESYAQEHGIEIMRMEDGFVRSQGLGANHVLPYSICIDRTGIYFDARKPSDLETLLATYDFDSDPELMREAEECLQLICTRRVTKYNESPTRLAEKLYGAKNRARILVIGQVEDDQSVVYGCDKRITNNDVVRLAAAENPDAQIIYKVHPDVLAGKRAELSKPDDVADLALIIRQPMSFDDTLTGVDRVYTISSLGGFEALIRGIPVTTLGAPFYSGWGLTDSRQAVARRSRVLTLTQLFAAAYLKYASYFEPATGAAMTLREVIERLGQSEPSSVEDHGAEEEATAPLVKTVVFFGAPYSYDVLQSLFEDADIHVIDRSVTSAVFKKAWAGKVCVPGVDVYVWGGRLPEQISHLIKQAGGKIRTVTPGVVHQLGIGKGAFTPAAWNVERDVTGRESDGRTHLMETLDEGDFVHDEALMAQADVLRKGVLEILDRNSAAHAAEMDPNRPQRILVIGQPEDHPAVNSQGPKRFTSNDLVMMARMEHPGAEIVYRVDIANLKKKRAALSDPSQVASYCSILSLAEPISAQIEGSDRVYTISHIGGFEALLRGKPVTVFGTPFYAGWGLTEDRQALARGRALSIDELFVGCCLAAPIYVDPLYKVVSENPALMLQRMLTSMQPTKLQLPEPTAESKLTQKQTVTYLIGEIPYKSLMSSWFPNRRFIHIPLTTNAKEFSQKFKKGIDQNRSSEFITCQGAIPLHLRQYIRSSKRKNFYLGEGFIRSVELPQANTPPYSLVLDGAVPFFDSSTASDLENIIAQYDFDADIELMQRARLSIELLVEKGVSKFNHSSRVSDVQVVYGVKNRPRVLVLGQSEYAPSVKLANPRHYSNNDVVMIAAMENPGAQIIFKPHPEVMSKARPTASNPDKVRHLCDVLAQDLPISQALETVDHVYTISSLGGFEALLRNIKVTTLGSPFYAGWGISDDRQPPERRQRQLSVEQVFAAAYILYPVYVDPLYKVQSTIETMVPRLLQSKASMPAPKQDDDAILAKIAVAATQTLPEGPIPEWFNGLPGAELTAALSSDKPVLLYIPWIAEHGNKLIAKIGGGEDYVLAPLDFVKNLDKVRSEVLRFARENPHTYRKMILRRLVSLRGKIKGIVFTFDWAPVMRLIAGVCEDLEIPRILIPHESVFVDREKYYWDITAHASVPVADVILGWGQLQKDIFVERGYPAERFIAVGAPKFDSYFNYQPELTRQQFCRLFGLDPALKIILFASQPLDSQLDVKTARESQRKAIADLLDCADAKNLQLIVRLPPSKDNILGKPLQERIAQSSRAAVDDALCYLVSAEEALFHSDIVASVNSTMLFEGMLMGRIPLSTKYTDFTQIWESAGIPAVRNAEELAVQMDQFLAGEWQPSVEGINWAAQMFSTGAFDGQACRRIADYLKQFAANPSSLTLRPRAIDRIFSRTDALDVIAIPSSEHVWNNVQKYLLPMIRARRRVVSSKGLESLKELASVDVFIQWGITPNVGKIKQAAVQRALGKPLLIIEDGFIRSLDIGLSGEPGLSIIMDDTTSYYDATKPSRLQRLLEDGPALTKAELARSRKAIQKIVETRVSKYNHAPNIPLNIGTPGRKKVLLVDQRFGDQSVASGLADEKTYERMLNDVLREHADCDIMIKQHPDAIKGGKSSYYSNERLYMGGAGKYINNLFLINFDVNPYSLFELVDEVYVVTSGMGFEALMAGKIVHCYGAPFYAGWGITQDKVAVNGRTRKRKIEDVFHYSYIESSRYFHPEKNETVEVEELVDYIDKKRKW